MHLDLMVTFVWRNSHLLFQIWNKWEKQGIL